MKIAQSSVHLKCHSVQQIAFAVIFKEEFAITHNKLATLALQTKNYY